MIQEPSKGTEDPKEWLNLSIFVLGLMKSAKGLGNVM